MDLWLIVIILLAIAIILLIVSFFVKEEESPLLSQIADFTLQMTEEMHELKTRVTKLEQEVMAEEADEKEIPIKKLNAVTKQHVVKLFQQGKTYDEIGEQLELPETTVQLIIDNYQDTLSTEE